MAFNSTNPILLTTAAVVTPGTSVAPGLAIPDNCHTIKIRNPSASQTVYYAIAAAGTNLSAAGTGWKVYPMTTEVLPIGTWRIRGLLTTTPKIITYDATAAVTVEIQYLLALSDLA